jgi:hypothetical protein
LCTHGLSWAAGQWAAKKGGELEFQSRLVGVRRRSLLLGGGLIGLVLVGAGVVWVLGLLLEDVLPPSIDRRVPRDGRGDGRSIVADDTSVPSIAEPADLAAERPYLSVPGFVAALAGVRGDAVTELPADTAKRLGRRPDGATRRPNARKGQPGGIPTDRPGGSYPIPLGGAAGVATSRPSQ